MCKCRRWGCLYCVTERRVAAENMANLRRRKIPPTHMYADNRINLARIPRAPPRPPPARQGRRVIIGKPYDRLEYRRFAPGVQIDEERRINIAKTQVKAEKQEQERRRDELKKTTPKKYRKKVDRLFTSVHYPGDKGRR